MPQPAENDRPAYRQGREALLDATARVVARRGLRGLTYRAVGLESGTTHALVTYHFGSRHRLILEAARHASREVVAASTLEDAGRDPGEFAGVLPTIAAEQADIHAFLFELAIESRRNEDLRPEVLEQYEEYRAATLRALEALDLPDASPAMARLVFAAIDGLTLQQLVDGDAEATAEAVAVLQRVLGALSAPQQQA